MHYGSNNHSATVRYANGLHKQAAAFQVKCRNNVCSFAAGMQLAAVGEWICGGPAIRSVWLSGAGLALGLAGFAVEIYFRQRLRKAQIAQQR